MRRRPSQITERGYPDAFERFGHEDGSHLLALIKAGLLHVQFETIHGQQARSEDRYLSPTVNVVLDDLERFGIVEEITGRKRERVFSYRRYLDILSEGTDPFPTTA